MQGWRATCNDLEMDSLASLTCELIFYRLLSGEEYGGVFPGTVALLGDRVCLTKINGARRASVTEGRGCGGVGGEGC